MPGPPGKAADDGGRSGKGFGSFDRRVGESLDYMYQVGSHLQSHLEPIIDPLGASGAMQFLNFKDTSRILTGRIVCSIPYADWYSVQLEGGDGNIPCCTLSQNTMQAIGTRSIGTLPPGHKVCVIKSPNAYFGCIMGVIPEIQGDGKLTMPDVLVQGSQSGFKREAAYKKFLEFFREGQLKNFSGNKPWDGTAGGEWGGVSETGIRCAVDSFMFQLAVSEACGIFGFYHDEILRLCGVGLDINSAVQTHHMRDDEGESVNECGHSPFPWEMLGATTADATPFKTNGAQAVQFSKPEGPVEPAEDDQVPILRFIEDRGYTGQGFRRQLMTKPPIFFDDPTKIHKMSEDNEFIPLWEEWVGLNGRYYMRSAKSISIRKSPILNYMQRKKRPEDKSGDDAPSKEYQHSGLYHPPAPDHVVGDIDNDNDLTQLAEVAGVLDLFGYVMNWESVHPYFYHTSDFKAWEEDDHTFVVDQDAKNYDVPGFGRLASNTYLDPASEVESEIDHRYNGGKKVKFIQSDAYWTITEDGGIVLGDGFGSEIRMSGGHIFLTAPGDIWFKSGRNVNAFAGDDLILKAHRSADITTTKNDVRIKAHKNIQVVAGVGDDGKEGAGGILLESLAKAPQHEYKDNVGEEIVSSGVIVRCSKSEFVTWAKDIYLRTGGQNKGEEDVIQSGNIVLDSSKGEGDISLIAEDVINYVNNSVGHCFKEPGTEDTFRGSNLFTYNLNVLGDRLNVCGQIVGDNGLLLEGGITVIDGHITTEQADAFNNDVTNLDQPDLGILQAEMERIKQFCRDLTDKCKEEFTEEIVKKLYEEEDQIGNEELQKIARFQFRDESQYGTTSMWFLPEDRWQQLARLDEQSLPTWKECFIDVEGEQFYPYPGTRNFKERRWSQLDLTFYQVKKGYNLNRESEKETYEKPKYQKFDNQPLDDYIVVK